MNPSITKQEVGRIVNDNPADQVNTIDKMAQKRALVAATLIAVNASEFFTQDLEDMVIEGTYEPETTATTTTTKPPKSNGGNGRHGDGTKVEPLPPEQWNSIEPPADFKDMWDRNLHLLIGYNHKQHAINTLVGENGIYPGKKLFEDVKIEEAWSGLLDHQRSKQAEEAA